MDQQGLVAGNKSPPYKDTCHCVSASTCLYAVHDTCRLARRAQSSLLKLFLKDVTREAKRQVMVVVYRPHHQHIKQIELTDKIKYLEASARCFCPLCQSLPRCIRKLKCKKKAPKSSRHCNRWRPMNFGGSFQHTGWTIVMHLTVDLFSRAEEEHVNWTTWNYSLLEKVNRSCPPAGLGSARLKLLFIVLHERSENFRHGF